MLYQIWKTKDGWALRCKHATGCETHLQTYKSLKKATTVARLLAGRCGAVMVMEAL